MVKAIAAGIVDIFWSNFEPPVLRTPLLKSIMALSVAVGVLPLFMPAGFSLIPDQLSTAPHYYTTWATQGYMPGDGWTSENLTVDWIFQHQGSYQEATLNSNYLFGKPGLLGSGWVRDFFPQSRAELYFMLDEGYATDIKGIEVNPKNFPEFNQSDPSDRLVAFQHKVVFMEIDISRQRKQQQQ